MKKYAVCLMALLLIVPVLAIAEEAPKYGKEVGQALKPFDLPQVEGGNVTLESLAGKKTVLIFMQSSCTQCRDEMRAANEMYEEVKDKANVVAIGVDIESRRLTQYKKAYKITFPILLDPEFAVGTSAGVRVTPATVVLDKEGKIVEKILGGLTRGDVEELFGKL